MKRRTNKVLGIVAGLVVGGSVVPAWGSPFLEISVLGRKTGTTDPFTSQVTNLAAGTSIDYQVAVRWMDFGTTNTNAGVTTTLTSLVVNDMIDDDGLNNIKFDVGQFATVPGIAINFGTNRPLYQVNPDPNELDPDGNVNVEPNTLNWGGGSSLSRGTVNAAKNQVNGIKPGLTVGGGLLQTYVGQYPDPMVAGKFTIGSMGDGSTSLVDVRWFDGYDTFFKVNGGTLLTITNAVQYGPDPVIKFTGLTLLGTGGTQKPLVVIDAPLGTGTDGQAVTLPDVYLLGGGSLNLPIPLKNTGNAEANPVTVTATGGTVTGSPLQIAAGGTNNVATLHVSATGTAVATVHDGTAGATDIDDTVTVKVVSQGSAAPGQTLQGSVGQGQSYAGLSSQVNGGKNTVAVLLAGTASGDKLVSETWSLAPAEPVFGEGTGPNPEFASDILDLTGTGTDKIVLQMSYDDSIWTVPGEEQMSAAAGHIIIVSEQGGVWVPTISLNSDGGAGSQLVLGAWNGDTTLSHYGVDTTANVVWAVIDHNSKFGVVPEPASLSLLGLSVLGLAFRRRRHA